MIKLFYYNIYSVKFLLYHMLLQITKPMFLCVSTISLEIKAIQRKVPRLEMKKRKSVQPSGRDLCNKGGARFVLEPVCVCVTLVCPFKRHAYVATPIWHFYSVILCQRIFFFILFEIMFLWNYCMYFLCSNESRHLFKIHRT